MVSAPATNVRKQPRSRWLTPLLVTGLVIVLGAMLISSFDQPTRLDWYAVVDDHTLTIGLTSGPNPGLNVRSVVESDRTVTVTVTAFQVDLLPSSAVGYAHEVAVHLVSALGSRVVIDGSDGEMLRLATCPPPSVFASPCP